MSNGIAHNNLNDISKIYLETISDINKKEQEDDVKRWQQEESECGQNTRQQSPFKKKKVKAYKEAFSNWRKDLREVTSDAEAVEVDDQPEIKEKKVKNKIKINPEFKEAVKQMGGELLEVKEVDSPDGEVKDDKKKEQDDAAAKKIADKERKLKMRILRVKMMATKQDAGASIVAGYEPDIEGAVEYFYEEGINEEGIEQLVEEIGLDEFVNFIEGGTVELNEERAARRASVRAKKYDVVKKEVDTADAARKKSKKGEYSSAYKKKETDVTVYDDKPAKASVKKVKKSVAKAKAAKPAAKPAAKKAAPAKKAPAKKAPEKKAGLISKIGSAYKKGVERHKAARAKGKEPEKRVKEFGKGFASGVKDTVKFAGKVKKAVVGETLLALLDTLEEGAEIDKFDAVVAYLIDEQLVEDFDAANKVMVTLSESLIDEVFAEQKRLIAWGDYASQLAWKEGYQRNPEKGEKEDRKYERVRGERTPMPPRGNKRREDFEKWYAANVR